MILLAKDEGTWKFATFAETTIPNTLEDISWLVGGTWTVKIKDVTMSMKYDWAENKQFIRATLKTSGGKGPAVTATQYIGPDPASDGLRSWAFDSSGGTGQGVWTWGEGKWTISGTSTHRDGSVLALTNTFTPKGKNEILWKSVNRTLDGAKLPDSPELEITREVGAE